MAAPIIKYHKDITGADLHVNKLHAATHQDGGTDPLEYLYTQTASSDTWTITHNLGKYPHVTIMDTDDDEVIGEVHYVSESQVVLTFSEAISGKAYLA
jgi:hypothetical protein